METVVALREWLREAALKLICRCQSQCFSSPSSAAVHALRWCALGKRKRRGVRTTAKDFGAFRQMWAMTMAMVRTIERHDDLRR